MPSTHPEISVVIPAYNAERYLREAFESVQAQAYPSLEVLIVDDGSKDKTAEVAESFGTAVRYIFQENAGAAAARNHGVEQAAGEFIAFLDADDLWTEGKLARQMEAFREKPQTDIVLGQAEQFISPELDAEIAARIFCPPGVQPGFLPSAMVVRKTSFAKAGPFDTTLRVGEFIDWYSRAEEKGLRAEVIPHLVLRRRLHTTNQGQTKREDYGKDYLRILRARLARQRKTES
jgi:glycosyltransferase involved in cell wall biosynthesis